VRAFLVRLPSGAGYWTVIDEDLVVFGEADAFLRHVLFGRDGSELTTRAYAPAGPGRPGLSTSACSSPGCGTRRLG